jgi:uncharacterized protein (DUF2236 family)
VGDIFGGTRVRVPAWYRALTAQILPPPVREAFGIAYGIEEQRASERALAWLRPVYPMLPARMRHVGPYQEAQARISGRPRPDIATRLMNRVWIGQSSIAR